MFFECHSRSVKRNSRLNIISKERSASGSILGSDQLSNKDQIRDKKRVYQIM